MPAYVIVEIEVHNEDQYTEYKKLTPASIAAYKGKFIVRGGQSEALEGNWNPQRIVVLEFPDKTSANAWWNSKEYGPAKEIRQRSASTKMLLIEGYQQG